MKKHTVLIAAAMLGILMTGCGTETGTVADNSFPAKTTEASTEAASTGEAASSTAAAETTASAESATTSAAGTSAAGTPAQSSAGNTAAGSETATSAATTEVKENDYFYKITDAPPQGLSIASLAGTWVNVDDPSDSFTITAGSDIYDGTFTSGSVSGSVCLSWHVAVDYNESPWYTFYANDGSLWKACLATGDIPLDDLYAGNGAYPHYRRSDSTIPDGVTADAYGFYDDTDAPPAGVSVADLAGTWKDAVNPADYMTISSDGSFSYSRADGYSTAGYIKIKYYLNPDNSKCFCYTFYNNDGSLWDAFGVSGDIPLNDLYSGQSGDPHYVRSN